MVAVATVYKLKRSSLVKVRVVMTEFFYAFGSEDDVNEYYYETDGDELLYGK